MSTCKIFTNTFMGEPVPQQRHRHSIRGRFVTTYDPCSAVKMAIKKDALAIIGGNCPYFDADIPLYVALHFFVRPSMATQDSAAAFRAWDRYTRHHQEWIPAHRSTKDLDNLEKLILDAMTSVVYPDDRQIIMLSSKKSYDINPRTEVVIMPVEEIDLSELDKYIFSLLRPEEIAEIAEHFCSLAPILENKLSREDLKDIAEAIKALAGRYAWIFSRIEKKMSKDSQREIEDKKVIRLPYFPASEQPTVPSYPES